MSCSKIRQKEVCNLESFFNKGIQGTVNCTFGAIHKVPMLWRAEGVPEKCTTAYKGGGGISKNVRMPM